MRRFLAGATRILAMIAGWLGGLMCLAGLLAGIWLFGWWIVRLFAGSSVYYLGYSYFLFAAVWTAVSLGGIALGVHSLIGERLYRVAGFFAAVIGFSIVQSLPTLEPPYGFMNLRISQLALEARNGLIEWDQSHGRLPETEKELLDALGKRCLSRQPIFYVGTQPVPYSIKFVPNATQPYDGIVPTQPGTVVYAVRQDRREYWLTVTTLVRPVGGPVVFFRVRGDPGPWALRGEHIEPEKQ